MIHFIDKPAQQRAIADLVEAKEAKGQHVNDDTLRELIRFAQNSGITSEQQTDLFGEREVTQSLALEKAEVSAYIKQQIARDQRLFGFVAQQDRAARLGEAGNVIAVDVNRRISTEAAQAARGLQHAERTAGARGRHTQQRRRPTGAERGVTECDQTASLFPNP